MNEKIKKLNEELDRIEKDLIETKTDNESKDRLIVSLRADLKAARRAISEVADDPDVFGEILEALKKSAEKEFPEIPAIPSEMAIKEAGEIIEVLKKIEAKEYPKTDEVRISNLKDFPKVDNTKVVFGLKAVVASISGLLEGVKGLASSVFKAQVTGEVRITNNDIKEAIPVRLATRDLRYFYDAMVSVAGSGGSSLSSDKLDAILLAIRSIGGNATSMGSGRKAVVVTNTAVVLGSGTCKTIFINALTTNSDVVVVGDATIVHTEATRTGKILYPGDGITVSIDNLSKVYINGIANDGVSFSYVN